jgi:hypothetical protein
VTDVSPTAAVGPSPLRLIVVIDGTNLTSALDSRGMTTHVNYRQLGIEIAAMIRRQGRVELKLGRLASPQAP